MSTFSPDDSTCAPTIIPSPAEFSRLTLDPHASRLVSAKFNPNPGLTTTELRFYQSISHSIRELEKEFSRQKDERQFLYDQLFDGRKFRHNIRPIVMDYRHRLAMKRRGHYPYGRTSSPSTDSTSPDRNSYPSRPRRRSPSYTINPDDAIIVHQSPSPHTTPPPSGATSIDSFHTPIETLGESATNPIIIEDKDGKCT